ncbi:MAG: glycosyltransferase family 39 protein [Anaerolineae bacterium]
MRSRLVHLTSLILILLAGYFLRVYRLGAQNIWWDEGLAIWAVRKSFVGTTLWTAGDVHPPLYFWLLWPWTHLAGESEFAARYITLIYGILTIVLAYPFGKRLAGRPVGLLAALLVALSRFEVWWSQEMRMYMLAGLMGFMATYWLVRLVGRRRTKDEGRRERLEIGDWRLWGFYVLFMVAALYTIYLSIVFVVVHNVWILGMLVWGRLRNKWVLLRRWVVAQAIVAGLMLPWLALALPRMRTWRIIEEPPSLSFISQLYATLLATGISTNLHDAWLATAVIAAVTLLGTIYATRNTHSVSRFTFHVSRRWRIALLLMFAIIPPLLVWLITQPRSIFYSPRVEARYLLPFAAPAYVLLAWSIWELGRRWKPAGAGALTVVLAIFLWTLPVHYRDRYLRDDLQTMTQVIRAYAQPGDVVVLVSGSRYPVFLYYYDRTFDDAPVRPRLYQLPGADATFTEGNVARELAPIVSQHDRVWLAWVNGQIQDPAGLSETWLNDHRVRTLSLGFAHNALHLYETSEGEPTVPDAPWMVSLDVDWGTAHVLGYDLTTREFRPGDMIRLGLYARTSAPAAVTVRWVPDDHEPLAQQILELPTTNGAVIRRRVEFAVSEAVPAGVYHFELGGAASGDVPAFGELVVNRTRGPARDVQPDHPVDSHIGEDMRFLGYRLRGEKGNQVESLKPGQTVYLDLFWRAETPIDRRLTVFAHLLGTIYNPATGGPVWAGHDSEPLMGAIPTTQWPTDTVIVDRHPLTLDPGAPAGEYQIEVGLYDTATGDRLPVAGDGADEGGRRLLLGSVPVNP